MNDSASLTPIQGPSTVTCLIVTFVSQLPHWLHQLPTAGKAGVNTNLHTEFLLQIWKQQEDSTVLLARNKQHHKEKNTEKDSKGKA
jgi:hypothetical protein